MHREFVVDCGIKQLRLHKTEENLWAVQWRWCDCEDTWKNIDPGTFYELYEVAIVRVTDVLINFVMCDD